MKARVAGIVGGLFLAVIPAAHGATTWRTYTGPFMSKNAQVRCQLNPGNVWCVSMQTGRVTFLTNRGRWRRYFTTEPIERGIAPGDGRILSSHVVFLTNRRVKDQRPIGRGGIDCSVRSDSVSCFAHTDPKRNIVHDQYFSMSPWDGLINYRYFKDGPSTSPTPPGYVPPVTSNPWSAVIPDYRTDPGGTYGTISPVTGLSRTYYVRPYTRRDGTHVSGYFRSCSRCYP